MADIISIVTFTSRTDFYSEEVWLLLYVGIDGVTALLAG